MSEEMISISKTEYESLLDDSKFLRALQDAGVDNWEGYSISIDIYNEKE